jgi:hypothetical protein
MEMKKVSSGWAVRRPEKMQEGRTWHYVDSDIAATQVRTNNCARRTIDTIVLYSRCHDSVSRHLVPVTNTVISMVWKPTCSYEVVFCHIPAKRSRAAS